MVADKVPAVNHINDLIQTVVRPAAGAIAFAASAKVITDVNPVLALACGLLVAGSVHVAKSAAVRPVVTATTGGAGNVPVSIAEDVTSYGSFPACDYLPHTRSDFADHRPGLCHLVVLGTFKQVSKQPDIIRQILDILFITAHTDVQNLNS